MEITVNKQDMIKEVEEDMEEYREDYEKSVEAYQIKLEEYLKYVEKAVKNKEKQRLQSPPTPPISQIEQFEDSLEMLKAHVKVTIIMKDDEYRDLKSEHTQLKMNNTTTMANLASLKY